MRLPPHAERRHGADPGIAHPDRPPAERPDRNRLLRRRVTVHSFPGFITVRATSTRLPGKCFLPLGDMNVLEHVIRRARSYGIDPIVCTSLDKADDRIESVARSENAKFFRGSLVNKLKRWA